jgi:hypothetical protein
MKNIKSILEGISSQGKMMGSRGSSFRDSSSSSDQNSGLSIGASRAKDHEDATKDASIASEKNRKNEIEKRNKEAEQRQKETMQMSQEETVTEAKHVFHVHLHPIDTRLGKMVDDKTVEPIGNKPKGDKIKLTIPAADTRSARDKATRYAAKNFGVDNVKSIEYKGLHEETVTEAKMTKKFVFDKPYQPLVKAYSNHDTDHLKDMHKRWSESHQRNMKSSMDTNTSEKLLAVNHVLKSRGEDMKMPEHKNLGMHTYNMQEETNTEKKNVARMDDVEPTSEKSTLSKTGSIKTKIVEEKPTMSLPNFGLSASLIAAARQIVEKKDDVKLTGGKTQVEVGPETDDRSESDEDTSTSKKKKKLDSVGKEDDDVDNDGDSDKSDSYLKNRRKAIGKAIKEDEQLDEEGRVKLGQVSAGPDVKKDVTALKSKHKDTHTDFIVRTRGPKEPSAGLYKNIKVSPQGGMKSKSATGFAVYGRPKVAKEEVELDEVSKSTLGSYVKKASDDATKHSYMAAKTGDLDTAAKASKRIRGIGKATDKLTKEDFTADELARIDEIAKSIFEVAAPGLDSDKKYAKGDVTNAVLSDEKKPSMDDDQHKHPMQQLEKIAHSVEGREPSFEHKDGSKTKVGKTLARQLKSVHDSMKTTQEKNKFADSVHASRDSMRAAADKHL